METFSSDTNIWIDFAAIDQLALPFALPCVYLMSADAVKDELLSPPGIHQQLVEYGLQPVELTLEELFQAGMYMQQYKRLSRYDAAALAIAKMRNLTLLSGDGPLRRAAGAEQVPVLGTIGLLDRLLQGDYIEKDQYRQCLQDLLAHNGGLVRLPETELKKRLHNL